MVIRCGFRSRRGGVGYRCYRAVVFAFGLPRNSSNGAVVGWFLVLRVERYFELYALHVNCGECRVRIVCISLVYKTWYVALVWQS